MQYLLLGFCCKARVWAGRLLDLVRVGAGDPSDQPDGTPPGEPTARVVLFLFFAFGQRISFLGASTRIQRKLGFCFIIYPFIDSIIIYGFFSLFEPPLAFSFFPRCFSVSLLAMQTRSSSVCTGLRHHPDGRRDCSGRVYFSLSFFLFMLSPYFLLLRQVLE